MRSGADSDFAREEQASSRRVRDHRREVRFGRNFAINKRSSCKFADTRTLLHKLDLKSQQATWFDWRTKLRTFDGHEIDELARTGETEAFNRENTSSLCQRFDDQDTGHNRASREVPVEEVFIDRHRLDGNNRPVGNDFLDTVDQKHWITVRQGCHDRPNVEWPDWQLHIINTAHKLDYRPCGCG